MAETPPPLPKPADNSFLTQFGTVSNGPQRPVRVSKKKTPWAVILLVVAGLAAVVFIIVYTTPKKEAGNGSVRGERPKATGQDNPDRRQASDDRPDHGSQQTTSPPAVAEPENKPPAVAEPKNKPLVVAEPKNKPLVVAEPKNKPLVVANWSFENPDCGTNFEYNPSGASWTFSNHAGIAAVGSGFEPPTPPDGHQCAVSPG